MNATTIGTFLLAVTLIACSGGTDDGNEPANGGTGSETSANAPGNPATSGPAPEYNVSCHGDVSKRSIEVNGIGTRCVGGEPGTFCGDDPCAKAELEIRYEQPATKCGSTDVWAWDGTACKAYPTQNNGSMKCKGTGCEKLYKSESACKEAYAQCIAK